MMFLLAGQPLCAALAALEPLPPVVECSSLTGAQLSEAVGAKVDIEAATVVQDGKPKPYCKVTGVIAPAIRFEVRLPVANWTQRFVQTGCGGLCGNLNVNLNRTEGCVPATNGEVVLASTDMGHSNTGGANGEPEWAVKNPQAQMDFAYRGVHLTTLASKELIRKYYGRKPRYSYFSGCSDGGREALMEAQRYPGDFDGIAAGAPAMNFITQNTFYHGWNARVNTSAEGKPVLTSDKLPVLHQAVLAACDELDGRKDGILAFPPACHFDPATIICKPGQDAATCLTPAQASAAKEIYRGAHSASGEQFVISGPQYGSELAWEGVFVPRGSGTQTISAGMALGTMRYMAYPNPLATSWTLNDFQFDAATFDAVKPRHRIYDATDPNLSRFEAAGGKLLIWHGWSDPHISPLNSIAYMDAMRKTMGATKVAGFSRLFLFPGGYHCNGGEGPFDFQLTNILMNWVESGTAPDSIIARKANSPVTRPVYAYPKVARYKGTGDPDSADSYTGAPGPPLAPAALNWRGAPFYTPGYEQWCEWNGPAMACSDKAR